MKLSEWAKAQGISYITAYRWFKSGKLPVGAYQTESGTILVDAKRKEEHMLSLMNGRSNLRSVFDDAALLLNAFDSTYWPSHVVERRQSQRFRTLNEEKQYAIVGEVPGFTQEEIKVSVSNNILTISGKHEMTKESERYFSKDASTFEASYTLPNDADLEKISADHKNGILEITIPKHQKSQQIREVPIKQLKAK